MNDHETSQAPFDYLYRVLRRDEDDKNGITAKNPFANIPVYTHVNKGSYRRSQFISTAGSLDAAELFARKSKGYREGLAIRIARINTQLLKTSLKFIDLSNSEIRRHYFPEMDFAHNCARKFEEVLVVGKIPAECIDDIRTLRIDSDYE